MLNESADVIIIGAGVAGLTAARLLGEAGLRVLILEARERVGGRVWTIQDRNGGSVEMGAEFIHGRPGTTFDLVRKFNLEVRAVGGQSWIQVDGRLRRSDDFFSQTRSVMEKMNDAGPDRSLANFLDECCMGEDAAKLWSLEYVEGFDGALAERVSVHSLVRTRKAEREMEGEHAFRFLHGYDSLVAALTGALPADLVRIQLGATVRVVRWTKSEVKIQAQVGADTVEFRAPRAVVTLPLGVLQAPPEAACAVHFDPPLEEKADAMMLLYMGHAIRISMVFSEKWWEQASILGHEPGALSDLGFVFSHQDWFPTWWTRTFNAPILTGWAASRRGERLSGKSTDYIRDKAIASLTAIFEISRTAVEGFLRSFHVHDWQTDPYARGSYSYVGVGGEGAQSVLAGAVEDTLFFAGEATNTEGHHGTVHGAIATGERAARDILSSMR